MAKLAPFNDLMRTAIYSELSERPAMKIGGEDQPKWIIARSWEKLAGEAVDNINGVIELRIRKYRAGLKAFE